MNTLFIYRGGTHVYEMTFVDENGAALNLTGLTVRFMAKKKVSDDDSSAVLSEVSSGASPGIVITNPATLGKAILTLEPADTASLEDKALKLDYQVRVDGPGGTVKRVADEGKVQIKPQVIKL